MPPSRSGSIIYYLLYTVRTYVFPTPPGSWWIGRHVLAMPGNTCLVRYIICPYSNFTKKIRRFLLLYVLLLAHIPETKKMNAAAEIGRNSVVSKHKIQPEYGNEQAEYSFSLFSWPG